MSSIKTPTEIKRFKPEIIAQASVILVLGKRFSGKSILIKDLMYQFRERVDRGIIFSGTEHAAPFYGEVFPDIFVHPTFDNNILEGALHRQIKIKKKQLRETQSDKATPKSTLFVLMDDCLADTQWKSDKNMKEIFFNGRHYHFFFILASQYPMSIPAQFRSNSDYTFIYSEKDQKVRRKIWENYCGIVPTFEEFSALMDTVCTNYGCLVVNNRERDKVAWQDAIFWYRAEMHEPFRFGSPLLWKYHDMYIKDSDDEDNDNDYLRQVVQRYGDKKTHTFMISA